jgi:hypothetical protein
LPSIIPSYVYMFFAMTIVGTLLIFSFNSYASTLRSVPETEQLDNLLNYVASKATELLIQTTADSTTQFHLNLPTRIGDKEYWLCPRNDTIQSWIEGGLGRISNGTSIHKVFLPGKPATSGQYSSGFGLVVLRCSMNGSVPQIFLTRGGA